MNMKTKAKQNMLGFTLIELMITIVIIGVIAGLGIPSYNSSVRKSKRTEAKAALLELMARQEQYFSEKRVYAINLSDLNWNGSTSLDNPGSTNEGTGQYDIEVSFDADSGVTSLVAKARGRQAKDTIASFGLDSVGRKWHTPKDGSKETGWGK